jgi:hypothetical protein
MVYPAKHMGQKCLRRPVYPLKQYTAISINNSSCTAKDKAAPGIIGSPQKTVQQNGN